MAQLPQIAQAPVQAQQSVQMQKDETVEESSQYQTTGGSVKETKIEAKVEDRSASIGRLDEQIQKQRMSLS